MNPSPELYRLIKSLSKSEKRFFKLMSSLQQGNKNYIRLFDAIDQQKQFNDSEIKEIFANEKLSRHLPSEKNHLYKLILRSLRMFHSEQNISSVLADFIQSIEILYNKALYKECGKLIHKAKEIARMHERFYYLFELIKWEKQLLEEEFQAGRFDHDLNDLVAEEQQVIRQLKNLAEYQILYSKINYVFRKGGYVRNDTERQMVDEIALHELIKGKNTALSRRAAATCYYIKGLCAITRNDVEDSFENFSKVVRIFEENPNLIQDIPKQYIKSLGNLFFYFIKTGDFNRLFELIKEMRSLEDKPGFNRMDIKIRIFISTHYFELLAYERMGKFEKASFMIEGIREKLREFGDKATREDHVMFEHLFANVFFGAGRYREALRQLNEVINNQESALRQDIYDFSRLFLLLIHYELNNFDLFGYLCKTAERHFNSRKKIQQSGFAFETAFIRHFKKLSGTSANHKRRQQIFDEMKKDLTSIVDDRNERVALEYFDYLTWINAKIQERSYGDLKSLNSKITAGS